MDILLYNNISDRRTLTKSITLIRELTGCELYDGSSLSNPIFKLKYSPEYIDCNYIYIPEFKRYYFCRPDVEPGGIIYFYCECDVLMSNLNEILAIQAIAECSENMKSAMVQNQNYHLQQNRQCQTLAFNRTPFTANYANDRVYLLTVLGGVDGAT